MTSQNYKNFCFDPLRSILMQSVNFFQNMKDNNERKNSKCEFYLALLIIPQSEKKL